MPEFCTAERDGHVLTITINRPERMNALHSPAHYEMDALFNEFESDPDLWVAILTGAGERAFSAGNDLPGSPVPNITAAACLARSLPRRRWRRPGR